MSDVFDNSVNLDEVSNFIVDHGIDKIEAINLIMSTLRENYGRDRKMVSINDNQNPAISKKMNFYFNDDIWYIRVRKEKSLEFAHNDFVTINANCKGLSPNKFVISIETRRNKMAPIIVCPMHENRLGTKVNFHIRIRIFHINLSLSSMSTPSLQAKTLNGLRREFLSSIKNANLSLS